MGTQLPLPNKGAKPPIFGPCLLWPNGWMDEDGTWHGGGPRSRPHHIVLDGDPAPTKEAQPPIFRPCVLCPNGGIHQDTTCYGGRPQPKRHCVRWALSSPSSQGAQSPQFSAHVRCGQTVGWTKMPLGMDVGLGPGDFVLDGNQ